MDPQVEAEDAGARAKRWLESALEHCAVRIRADAALGSEYAASRAEFVGAGAPQDAAAARRHLEWFALERYSERLQGVPAEIWWERERSGRGGAARDSLATLLGSRAGVFEVLTASDAGLVARDLLTRTDHAVSRTDAVRLARAGDVIVGRLFPAGGRDDDGAAGEFEASPAVICLRSDVLLTALRADLDALRRGRRGPLRMSQKDLEHMFHGVAAAEAPAPDEAVDRARALLEEAGLAPDEAVQALTELAREPFEPEHVVPGANDALGALLERLAFETEVDLARARETLLAAWLELSREPPARSRARTALPGDPMAPVAPTERGDRKQRARAALAEFDRGRARGEDLEALFAKLETDLGLDTDEDSDDEDESALGASVAGGTVDGLVDEYVWESQRDGVAVTGLEHLRGLASFASALADVDDLGAATLAAYAAHWCIDQRRLDDEEAARTCARALTEFAAWLRQAHGWIHAAEAEATLAALERDLPRVARANARTVATAPGGRGAAAPASRAAPAKRAARAKRVARGAGRVGRVVEIRANGAEAELELQGGGRTPERESVAIDAPLGAELAVGDWIRYRRAARGPVLVDRVYPPSAGDSLSLA